MKTDKNNNRICDYEVTISSQELKALKNILKLFIKLKDIEIHLNNIPSNSYWSETKEIINILNNEGKYLSQYSKVRKFKKMPVSFYYKLLHNVLFNPNIMGAVDNNDVLHLVELVRRIKSDELKVNITIGGH